MNTVFFILNQGHKKQGKKLHIHTKILISHTRNDPSLQFELKPSLPLVTYGSPVTRVSPSRVCAVGKGHSLAPFVAGLLGPKWGSYLGGSTNSKCCPGYPHLVPCLSPTSLCHTGLAGVDVSKPQPQAPSSLTPELLSCLRPLSALMAGE